MQDGQLIMLCSLATILMMGAFCVIITWRMQTTIDALSSKLMAKDLKEYTVTLSPQPAPKERPTEQLSWFDDPHELKEADA